MIDHVDILKDGASAVYGSDAISGVVNFFLVHKFRGLEIGATYGNTNMGASNEMGEWETWIKAGTGDDKTDIVVIADFWERPGGVFSRDRDISSNGILHSVWWIRCAQRQRAWPCWQSGRLLPSMFFGPGGIQIWSEHTVAAFGSKPRTSPFYKSPFTINPNAYPGAPGIHNPLQQFDQTGTQYKGGGNYFFFNFAAFTPASASGRPPSVLRLVHPRYVRQIPDGIWRF